MAVLIEDAISTDLAGLLGPCPGVEINCPQGREEEEYNAKLQFDGNGVTCSPEEEVEHVNKVCECCSLGSPQCHV